MDAGARSATRPTGSTATAASSGSTRTTGSPGNALRPVRSTRAPGTVRQSWNDPLGFAGLDKSAPPWQAPEVIGERIAALEAEAREVDAEVDRLTARAARPRAGGPGARRRRARRPSSTRTGPRRSSAGRATWPRSARVARASRTRSRRSRASARRSRRASRGPARAPAAPAPAGPAGGDALQHRRRGLVRRQRRRPPAGDRGARRHSSS